VPDRIEDLKALLDNRRTINGQMPAMIEALSDNYYTTYDYWSSWPIERDRDLYVWHESLQTASAWQQLYQRGIYVSNVVLDQLSQVEETPSNRELHNQVR